MLNKAAAHTIGMQIIDNYGLYQCIFFCYSVSFFSLNYFKMELHNQCGQERNEFMHKYSFDREKVLNMEMNDISCIACGLH